MTVPEALRGAWEQAKMDSQGVDAIVRTTREAYEDAVAVRDSLAAQFERYEGGHSPPAALVGRLMRYDSRCADLRRLLRDMAGGAA